MSPRFLLYGILCAAPILSSIGPTKAADAPTETTQPTAKYRTIRANSELRTIEVVTDRDETVEQFFARQKLTLVDNANSDGENSTIQQFIGSEESVFFVSYPLQNDQDFAPYLYGGDYQLAKSAPAVAALFADNAALNWENTILILAPLPDEATNEDNFEKEARLVGRISIKDRENWRPDMDAKTLKYQAPAAKAD